ncbi:MAG: chemotaxis protein CheW [Nitrosomonas sp.]|nr:chemotaxis protein CheW [Nitrosomonas sp.]
MREYQLALTERINSATNAPSPAIPMLGVSIGEDRWLVPMNSISEVLPVPKITPVPMTQRWFLGAINVRGYLYGISDIAAYLGHAPTPLTAKSRIILFSPRLGANSGLLVSNLLGIRNLNEFKQLDDHDVAHTAIKARQFVDKQDRLWLELNLRALIHEQSFIRISR